MESCIKILGKSVRVDRALTNEFPAYSRTYFQQLIKDNNIRVNGAIISKPSIEVKEGDLLEVTFPPLKQLGALPLPAQELGASLVAEHEDFLIVYKPAGLLVHAPNHHRSSVTLVDWLIHSFKELTTVGTSDRPGIVHRLDKNTSGLLVVPRTPQSHMAFANLFQARAIQKTYLAVVEGHPPATGTLDAAIGRDPFLKHKMATIPYGRPSLTHYKVIEYFPSSALVEAQLITGRTHQIRVHFSAAGYPVLGDSVYGPAHPLIQRQALHAHKISFTYKEQTYSFSSELPDDMSTLIAAVRNQDLLKTE